MTTLRAIVMCGIIAGLTPKGAAAQNGVTYHFQEPGLKGQVWVLGNDARMEVEPSGPGTPGEHGRIRIWKDGGKQVFALDPVAHTYYEENAYYKKWEVQQPSTSALVHEPSESALTVGLPFHVDKARLIKTELKPGGSETVEGYFCERQTLTFSYGLVLSHVQVPDLSMTAMVRGSLTLCMIEPPQPIQMPFGHGVTLTSGIGEVDAAFAKELSTLSGVTVVKMLEVRRQIDNGQPVVQRSAFLLKDLQAADVPPDRFELPKDYRFQEPVVVPPVKKGR